MTAVVSTVVYGAYAADLIQRSIASNLAVVVKWRSELATAALPVIDEL